MEKSESIMKKIKGALKKSRELTITQLVDKTKLNRSAVRTALAKLDGAGKVKIKRIGMAKVYSLI